MNKIPKIRFSSFFEEWTPTTLSDNSERVVRKNEHLECTLPLTVSAQYGLIAQEKFFNSKIASSNLKGYYLVQNGEFAYNKSSSQDYPFGAIKRLDEHKLGVLSTLYIVFALAPEINSDYMVSYFDSPKWHNDVRRKACEGARNHGLLNISASDFLSMGMYIPSSDNEQEQIGCFFKNLNKLITRLSDELEKLKQLKQASLQTMFPQDGESSPRVRFKGFSGEWICNNANSIFVEVSEKGYPDLPVLSATQERGMVIRSDYGKVVIHDKKNEYGYKRVQPGQFVIHLRSFQGGFAHSPIEGITSPAYTIFEIIDKKKHDDLFWKYVFSSREFVNKLRIVTYGIRDGRSISYSEFLSLPLLFPSKEEQSKIAQYFADTDKLIKIKSDELERLRHIRTACLNGMFVAVDQS